MVHRKLGLVSRLLCLLRRRRVFRIEGESMRPGLAPGDRVIVDPGAYASRSPQPGEIVLARHPFRRSVDLVKRVSAVLPDGRLRLAGDNPSESTDSRAFGAIPKDLVLGRVLARVS